MLIELFVRTQYPFCADDLSGGGCPANTFSTPPTVEYLGLRITTPSRADSFQVLGFMLASVSPYEVLLLDTAISSFAPHPAEIHQRPATYDCSDSPFLHFLLNENLVS